MDWVTAGFLVAGIVLVASEFFHLSLVPLFLGAAALVVAGLRTVGAIEGIPASLLAWSVASCALTLPLRPILRRMLGQGERRTDTGDEDTDAVGMLVDVLEPISDHDDNGRIRFQGSTWSARAVDGSIPRGAHARLVYKDKLVWIVEPLGALEDTTRVPVLNTTDEVKL